MPITVLSMWTLGNMGAIQMEVSSEPSAFGQKYLSHRLGIPGDKFLPNFYTNHLIPHVIVADEAFPLLPTLMRHIPKTPRHIQQLCQRKKQYSIIV